MESRYQGFDGDRFGGGRHALYRSPSACRRAVLAFGQRRDRGPIVPDQRKLLRATPALDPPFRFQCLQSRWELLAPDECHRGVFLCEAGHRAALMLADAAVEKTGRAPCREGWSRYV